ncbi:aspartate aminotransferase family protein [Acidobacteriota bacterium]
MKLCYPHGHVLYRDLHKIYHQIERGQGIYLYDREGKKYLDANGGAAVVNIGHGVKEIAEAISTQAQKVGYLSGLQFSHFVVETLAEQVSTLLPFSEGKALFLTSGSEATEASIKLARQYWVERGKTKKFRIISRSPGYHGNTLAALSLSERRHYKEAFRPMLHESTKIPAPYCYRCYDEKTYPSCRVKCAYELEKSIQKLGKENVSAFITEVIGGTTTGASVPPSEYFQIIRKICDDYEVLMIVDEIMTGMGRTGKWLACCHFDLVPDIVVLGKGLTGGYFPLSAVAVRKNLIDSIYEKGHNFLHAQTYAFHPVGCAASSAVIDYIKNKNLVDLCSKTGRLFFEKINSLLSFPHVGDIRGKGLLAGIEFVKDKQKKTPFPRQLKYVEQFITRALEKGLILWPNYGHADGVNGDLVLLAPPFIIGQEEISQIVDRLDQVLQEMESLIK